MHRLSVKLSALRMGYIEKYRRIYATGRANVEAYVRYFSLLGLQAMFSRNWFAQAEYMNNKFLDRTPALGTTVKLKSDAITLTAGYKF